MKNLFLSYYQVIKKSSRKIPWRYLENIFNDNQFHKSHKSRRHIRRPFRHRHLQEWR